MHKGDIKDCQETLILKTLTDVRELTKYPFTWVIVYVKVFFFFFFFC